MCEEADLRVKYGVGKVMAQVHGRTSAATGSSSQARLGKRYPQAIITLCRAAEPGPP